MNTWRSDCGLFEQPLAQEAELLLEDLERLGVLELLDFAPAWSRARCARLAIALEIFAFRAGLGAFGD